MAKDQQGALDFYKDLFGWSGEPGPAEFGGYAVMELGGRPVCGIGPAMAPEGMPEPPHVWTTYLSSDDADASAARIKAANGTVMFEPMDVGTLGRMLVATDPTGAVFGVWGHKDFFGAVAVNEPGALCWNECNTRDVPAAAAFYQAAFDITADPAEIPGYFELKVQGKAVGGLQDMGTNFPAEVPPHWMTWFAVDDVDSTVDAAVKRNATVVLPPMDMPIGRIAGIQDPWGGVFCVIKLA
jgi:predicted enzyme related to lactoylglutathione lyase